MDANSRLLARAILHDRTMRRKMMLWLLMSLIAGVALGTWGIDKVLASNVILFCVYWCGLCVGVLLLLLLCIYDMLNALKGQ